MSYFTYFPTLSLSNPVWILYLWYISLCTSHMSCGQLHMWLVATILDDAGPDPTLVNSDYVAGWKENPELGAAILCEDTANGRSPSSSQDPVSPLQTDSNYSLPWATPCAKNFTSIIPYCPQSYLGVLLLLLGHKRLCKLPKVRELLSGSARIQNQFCLTVEFKLFLSVLYPFPPAPLDIRTWMAAISFRTCPTARSAPLPSMPVSVWSPFLADSAWISQPVLQPNLPRLWW